MTLPLLFWSISSHICYDKPWGTNTGKVASDISNSYKYGEGEVLETPTAETAGGPDLEDRYPIFHTIIGDETGQISLEERGSIDLQDMNRGDKIRVIGARMGGGPDTFFGDKTKLVLSPYGSIVRI